MKNLCFIGTSHLGSLHTAWYKRLAPLYPEFNATFFTGPNVSLFEAEFQPNTITAISNSKLEEYFKLSANGLVSINLEDYDCFIFQSLDHHFIALSATCELMSADHLESTFFSEACLEAAIETSIEQSPIMQYIKHIRVYTEKPIIVSITPRTSILALEHHPKKYRPYLQYADGLEQLFIKAQSKLLNYPNLTIIGQPEETLATAYFTKVEYLNPYDKEDLSTDYWHKNVKYGKATMIKILEHLNTLDL